MAGPHGTGRRMLQPLCASLLQIPLRLGAIQNMLDRVAHAIEPHSRAMARQARRATVHDVEATPWLCTSPWPWLWGMAHATVACSLLHPRRSHEALAALIDAWAGMLVRAGYGVSHTRLGRLAATS